MRKLQRYLFFEILRTFTLVVTGLTVVLMFAGAVKSAAEYGLAPEHLIKIVPYFIPSLLPFTIPATLLLTVSIVYGRVSGDLEMTAAKSAGINPARLLFPALLIGAALSAISFLMTDRVGPWAVGRIHAVVVEAMEDIVLKQLRNEGSFSPQGVGVDNLQIVVAAVEGKTLIRPAFRYRRTDGRLIHVEAREATLSFDLENGQAILNLVDWRGDIGGDVSFTVRGEIDVPIPIQGDLTKKNARDLSIEQLHQALEASAEKLRKSEVRRDLLAAMSLSTGQFERYAADQAKASSLGRREQKQVRKMRTELHSRPAMACSCFLFALLGAPFAVLRGKSQFFTTFLVCFLPIVGVYYPVTLGMLTQTKAGELDPRWAAWVADGMLLVAGVSAFWKTVRN